MGEVEASSREAALNLLQKYDLYITLLEPAETGSLFNQRIKLFERVSSKEVVIFSRQLAIMLGAMVPPSEALRTLGIQTRSRVFREKILKIGEEVKGGTPLSRAFSLYPEIFSVFYVSMIKSGEASGELSNAFEHLADHTEREYYLRSKVKGAMVYPSVIIFAMI